MSCRQRQDGRTTRSWLAVVVMVVLSGCLDTEVSVANEAEPPGDECEPGDVVCTASGDQYRVCGADGWGPSLRCKCDGRPGFCSVYHGQIHCDGDPEGEAFDVDAPVADTACR